MSDPNTYIDRAAKYRAEGQIFENEGKIQEAINKYIDSIQNLKTALNYESSQNKANLLKENIEKLLTKCESLKKTFNVKQKSEINEPPKKSPVGNPNENIPQFPTPKV